MTGGHPELAVLPISNVVRPVQGSKARPTERGGVRERLALNLGFFRKPASGPVCPGETDVRECCMRLRGWQPHGEKLFSGGGPDPIPALLRACERL